MMRKPLSVLCLLSIFAFSPPAEAKVFLTTEEALKLAFPGCVVERQTVFLHDDELEKARKLAGVDIESAIVHPYVATCGGRPVGAAYFDAHRVRTLPETLMVVVTPDDKVKRVEVLSFSEPEEYLPRESWYKQFLGKTLTPELAMKKDIRGIVGATLSGKAAAEAVRRVLALHQVVEARPERK